LFAESEHGHSPHHGTGIRWLDMIVAVSVIFISVVSLVVSIEHGRTMGELVRENQKMVAGSTMPFLTYGGSQFDPVTSQRILKLILKNGGVGPARIDWFELRYKGVPYSSNKALLHACCSAALSKDGVLPKGVFYANVSGMMLPQRESIDFIDLTSDAGPDLINALDDAREDIRVHACYCSVLEECWQTDFTRGSRPVRVTECHPPSAKTLW
jgi:hypothetical protein